MKRIITIIILLLLTTANAYASDFNVISEEDYADYLNSIGLFSGTDKGYELERNSSRIEGAVMTLRLYENELAVVKENIQPPFIDVPSWASLQLGYLYDKGIVSGVSDTIFDSMRNITANEYMTYLLKMLGYSATDDFLWSESVQYAKEIGILPSDIIIEKSSMSRGKMVELTYYVIKANIKGENHTLESIIAERNGVTSKVMDINQYKTENMVVNFNVDTALPIDPLFQYGDYIYYYRITRASERFIYRCLLDGTNQEPVFKSTEYGDGYNRFQFDHPVNESVIAEGEYLYFVLNYGIFKLNVNTLEIENPLGFTKSPAFHDGNAYFIRETDELRGYYSVNWSDKEYPYYTEEVIQYNLATEEEKVIDRGNLRQLSIHDDYLFYFEQSDEYEKLTSDEAAQAIEGSLLKIRNLLSDKVTSVEFAQNYNKRLYQYGFVYYNDTIFYTKRISENLERFIDVDVEIKKFHIPSENETVIMAYNDLYPVAMVNDKLILAKHDDQGTWFMDLITYDFEKVDVLFMDDSNYKKGPLYYLGNWDERIYVYDSVAHKTDIIKFPGYELASTNDLKGDWFYTSYYIGAGHHYAKINLKTKAIITYDPYSDF